MSQTDTKKHNNRNITEGRVDFSIFNIGNFGNFTSFRIDNPTFRIGGFTPRGEVTIIDEAAFNEPVEDENE